MTLVMLLYMADDEMQTRTRLKRNLAQKVPEVEYDATSHKSFLRCARYVLVERSGYFWMVSGCSGSVALLYVFLNATSSWYGMKMLRLIRIIMVSLVLADICRNGTADRNR